MWIYIYRKKDYYQLALKPLGLRNPEMFGNLVIDKIQSDKKNLDNPVISLLRFGFAEKEERIKL